MKVWIVLDSTTDDPSDVWGVYGREDLAEQRRAECEREHGGEWTEFRVEVYEVVGAGEP